PEWGRAAMGSGCGDRVDRSLDLLAELVGERSRAGAVRSDALAVATRNVGQPRLDEIGLRLVVVRLAGDLVGRQDDRVDAGLGRGAVDRQRDVCRRATCDGFGL